MEMPQTTKELPYIEFRFDKKGKMTLEAVSHWWGGKNSGFTGSGGEEGNTCLPKDLDSWIIAFKQRKLKEIHKEIKILEQKLKRYENRN